MKLSAMLLAALCLPLAPAVGQTSYDLGFDIGVAAPRGEFADNVDHLGLGIAGRAGWYLGDLPVMVGVDAGAQLFGMQTQQVAIPGGFANLSAEMETTSNIAQLHAMGRVQPRQGQVRPFAEGLLGLNYLTTQTAFKNRGEELASKTDQRDAALSAGAGVGVDVRVVNKAEAGTRKRDLYVSIGARYMFGGVADYVRREDIGVSGGRLTYTTTTSRVDMLQLRIGMTFPF
jgi:hypothetical protein